MLVDVVCHLADSLDSEEVESHRTHAKLYIYLICIFSDELHGHWFIRQLGDRRGIGALGKGPGHAHRHSSLGGVLLPGQQYCRGSTAHHHGSIHESTSSIG